MWATFFLSQNRSTLNRFRRQIAVTGVAAAGELTMGREVTVTGVAQVPTVVRSAAPSTNFMTLMGAKRMERNHPVGIKR